MSPQLTKTAIKSDEDQEGVETYHEQVALLAYRLWQERGCPDGSPEIDWFQAEEELQGQEHQTAS